MLCTAEMGGFGISDNSWNNQTSKKDKKKQSKKDKKALPIEKSFSNFKLDDMDNEIRLEKIGKR